MSEEEMQALAQAQEAARKAMMIKKIGRRMSILMGITLSFCLSLLGNLTSGHFTLSGFLISFAASTLISLIIGFLVPIKKVGDGICNALHLKPRSLPAHCAESFLSDLIYITAFFHNILAVYYNLARCRCFQKVDASQKSRFTCA